MTRRGAPGRCATGVFKAALIIPPGFSRQITEGRIGELGLFIDNVDSDQHRRTRRSFRPGDRRDPLRLRYRARAQA